MKQQFLTHLDQQINSIIGEGSPYSEKNYLRGVRRWAYTNLPDSDYADEILLEYLLLTSKAIDDAMNDSNLYSILLTLAKKHQSIVTSLIKWVERNKKLSHVSFQAQYPVNTEVYFLDCESFTIRRGKIIEVTIVQCITHTNIKYYIQVNREHIYERYVILEHLVFVDKKEFLRKIEKVLDCI